MDSKYFGVVEMAFSFGVVLAIGIWQLASTAHAKRQRIAREKGEDEKGAK